MKNIYKAVLLFTVLIYHSGNIQAQTTVSRNYIAPSSVQIDGVGDYGYALPTVTFNQGDFTNGCVVTDVDVAISWAKTDGTCLNPGNGNSFHNETSFRVNGPSGSVVLALPGTWSGSTSISSVVTTFSDGNPIPSGIPVTGTFGPNNGVLANFNGQSPVGAWNVDAGDNGAGDPLCFNYYEIRITTADDNTPPTLTVPSNLTFNADQGQCSATVSWTAPTVTDNCSATLTQTTGPSNGSLMNVGTQTVTYEAADPYGNSTTQSFTVTVVDAQNPVISCPGTVFAGCDTIVNYVLPTASDNCPGVTVNLVSGPASGGVFSAGTTAVTYQAQDASGNTASCSFNVIVDTESTDPTSITASTSNVCSGDPVTLTVNGGSLGTNAQWLWYVGTCGGQLVGAGSTITVNPLTTTTYYVRAVGPCNSTACVSQLISVTAAPTVGFSGITSPSACGSADGTITAVSSGGTPPYTYVWSNGGTGSTILGLAAGPYEVTVTDFNGCADFSSVSLNDPGASVVTLVSDDPDQVICAGDPVTFTASGAYQYQYYIGGSPVSTQNPYTTTAIQNGENVYVVGIDYNFCSFTTPGLGFIVNDVPVITETVTDPSACGVSDGTILTTVASGLPPYAYAWSNGEIDPNISGLAAGPYVLTVTDDNGCSSSETYALSDPGAQPVTLASTEDPNNEICEGESVTFTASGSVDYEFYINGVSVSTTNPYTTNALIDGESVVATGTDGNNCTATSNIIIPTVNPGPLVSLIVSDTDTTICAGQSLSFFASGALSYEFFVDGVSQGPASSTPYFVTSSLTDGQVVTVIGTDANSCDVESAGITVTVNPSPTVSITNSADPTSCGATDGALTADASGGTPGYTYTWSNGNTGQTLAFLNAGLYCVEVEDGAGCTATVCGALSDVGSTPVTMSSSSSNDTICGGQSVTFTASGSTSYVFYVNGIAASNSNPYVTDSLVDGDIIAVTGLDTQLCAATSTPVLYTVHPEVQIGITAFQNPTACAAMDGFANTVTIGGVPPFDYLWTDGQTTSNAVNLAAGSYAITVTDFNGCQSSDAVSLSDPGGFTISLAASPSDVVICDGTEIEFTASSIGTNTFEYFVDGVSAGITNPYVTTSIADGQTIVAVGTDANNCTATSNSFTYQVIPVPAVTLTLPNIACSNDDPTLFTGGSPVGGDYSVNYGGNVIIGNLFFPELAGVGAIDVDYTYTATNGCATTVTQSYNVLQAPQVDLGNDTTVCSITLDAGSGYDSYNWTPTNQVSQTINVLVTGVYEVTVVDANGCVGTDAIGVTVNPIPNPTVTPSGVVEFCITDTVTIVAAGGYSNYSWSTGSDSASTVVFMSDTVLLTVTNSYGCTATEQIIAVMNFPQNPPVVTANGPTEFCIGETVILTANAGYASYLWNSGSTTPGVTVTESGDYYVTVLDGNGCIDSSMAATPVTVTVWEPEPAVQQAGDMLTLTNAGDFVSSQWYFNGNPIPGATSGSYSITASGNYWVCVVDGNGCEGCSQVFEMTCCVGVEETAFDGDVRVYPNPNNGQFTLEVEMQHEMDMSVGLYDMIGKQIWMDADLGETNNLRKQYDLTELPDGVYFLRIFADDQMTVQKLIKQQ
ncbi:MAG: HYR domain-containing protein [Flavobacteriales bacterium]|nr:HYR domain-containing protein [Flavobacteriales bacterium]